MIFELKCLIPTDKLNEQETYLRQLYLKKWEGRFPHMTGNITMLGIPADCEQLHTLASGSVQAGSVKLIWRITLKSHFI